MSYATVVWKNKKTGKLVRNVIEDERHLFNFLSKFRVYPAVIGRVESALAKESCTRTGLVGPTNFVIVKNNGLFSKNYKGKLCAD